MPEAASAPTAQPTFEITLSGRRFRPATETTLEQDYALMAIYSDPAIAPALVPKDGDSAEAWVIRLVRALYATGQIWPMLGALLTEDGVEWSKASGSATGDLLRRCTDRKAKDLVQTQAAGMILSFFVTAALSRGISLRSLLGDLEPRQASLPLPAGPSLEPSSASASAPAEPPAAPSTTASGMTSSAPSQATTRAAPRRSSGGRSAKR